MTKATITNAENAKPLTIWTMTSGAAGMRSQANGLANAIAKNTNDIITEKTIYLSGWAALLPGHLNPSPLSSLTSKSSPLSSPWPDILISSGRRTSAISIAIGKQSQGKTFRVHLQNPQTPTRYFDLICSMTHDGLKGKNVINTNTALHKLTNQDIIKHTKAWANIWSDQLRTPKKGPVIGIILGGKTKHQGFDQKSLNGLMNLIKSSVSLQNAQILLTPSGRTENFVKSTLQSTFKDNPNVWIWDQKGPNPYLAILGTSDHLIVTADSVSMISEALFTPKPVHIYPLSGTSRRHQIFQDILLKNQQVNLIEHNIDLFVDPLRAPIDETSKIAHIIRQKINH